MAEGNVSMKQELDQLRREVDGFRNLLSEMQMIIGDLRRHVSGRKA